MSHRSWLAVLFGVALGACSQDDGLPDPATIEVLAGDGQRAPAGARTDPLVVVVRGEDGAPFPRAQVRWRVTAATGASLSDSVTLSDGLGRAEVVLTFGQTGDYVVIGQLVETPSQSARFDLTATPPPSLTGVSPTTFGGGETLTVIGQQLHPGLAFLVGGVEAAVHNVSPTGQGFTAIVPSCLPPGQVDLQVVVRAASSNVLEGTYGAPPDETLHLQPRAYVSMDLAGLAGCARVPAPGPNGAEYLFVVQSGSSERGLEADFRLQGDAPPPMAAPIAPAIGPVGDERPPHAEWFHDRLRRLGTEYADLPGPETATAPSGAGLAPIGAGHERDFRVCSDVHCELLTDFPLVTAVARYVGSRAAIYVDEAAPPGGLSEEDLQALGAAFDAELYELASSAFGAESDVDRNGVVVILMSGRVNGLTPAATCESSVITGFFHPIDLAPAFSNDARSNRGEVFYTLVPDPSGTISCPLSLERILRFVPVTFIHEFQHMISYNQHVLLRGGGAEYTWLNEGLSHLAEELGARHFLNLGDEMRFSQFVIGDLYDAYQYLTAPSESHLNYSDGSGTLAERGAAWLFLRWLVDQYGADMPRRLVETKLRGVENIAGATGAPFDRLVAEWALANYVSDLPDFEAPARLRFSDWQFRTTFAELHAQNVDAFPMRFPLHPATITGGAFDFTGTLRAGSGSYYLVHLDPEHDGFRLSLTRPDGGPLDGSVEPRLSVIRLR